MTTAVNNQPKLPPFVDALKKLHWGDILTIIVIMCSIGAWVLTRVDRNFDKINSTLERIERDNRDFHGRMCTLEEKYQNLGKKPG